MAKPDCPPNHAVAKPPWRNSFNRLWVRAMKLNSQLAATNRRSETTRSPRTLLTCPFTGSTMALRISGGTFAFGRGEFPSHFSGNRAGFGRCRCRRETFFAARRDKQLGAGKRRMLYVFGAKIACIRSCDIGKSTDIRHNLFGHRYQLQLVVRLLCESGRHNDLRLAMDLTIVANGLLVAHLRLMRRRRLRARGFRPACWTCTR